MKHARFLAATALASVLALPAAAATLDFASMTASWTNAVGGSVQSNNSPASFPNLATINWGSTSAVSGYDFGFASDPVPSPAIGVDTPFTLGTFTHRNQPIPTGTAITSVDLELTGDIRVNNAVLVSGATFNFSFAHNETPNNETPCELGDTIPCGDGVTISLLNTTDTFFFNGVEYTMSINGFIPLSGGAPSTFFFSDEGGNNQATLQGEFTSELAPIPLPAAGWMLIAGVGGLAALRRRKKAS